MHRRWLILFVLTFARTAINFQFQSLAALSPFLIEQFQLSYAALGSVIGLYLLPGVVVALPGGMIARRLGDKRIACLGLVAMTLRKEGHPPYVPIGHIESTRSIG